MLEPEGIPVAATVSVRREPDARPAGDSEVDPCEGLLDALEVTRPATERSGRFSLGPLSPGRYQLQAAADGFAAAVRAVVLPPGSPAVDVGKLVLQPVASLAVVVDPKLAAMEAPFELGVDLQQENVVLPSEKWRSVRRAEVGHELAVTFDNLSPGYYRTILSKVGTDLSFVQEVELARGVHQELILRPAPIRISGTVRRRRRGVPGAEVWLRAEGIDVKATSDQQGRTQPGPGRWRTTPWWSHWTGTRRRTPRDTLTCGQQSPARRW